ILTSTLIPSETQALSEAKTFLKGGQFLPPDLEDGRGVVSYQQYVDGQYVPTLGSSDADFVQADIFRESFTISEVIPADTTTAKPNEAEVRIMPANPEKGLARVVLSGSREQGKRIISADYDYSQVEYDRFETYPLITGPEAW